MDRYTVALVLEEIAVLMELHGENRFKARAFRHAARAIERAEIDVAAALRSGELAALPGLGPATTAVVRDLVEHGASRMHAELRARTPAGMIELLGVQGLGPSKIALLRAELGVESVKDLRTAIESGAILNVPGFGERTSRRLAGALTFAGGSAGRRRRPQALEAAARLAGRLALQPGVLRAEAAGELRRGWETVGSLELVAAVEPARAEAAAAEFAAAGALAITEQGAGGVAARLADGFGVRVRFVPPQRFGAALVEATGSAVHVASLEARLGRALAEVEAGSEEEVYALADVAWQPPECRETDVDAGGALAARRLVERADLHGTFHCHTTWSDGTAGVAEMAEAAAALGWRYLGISDHSRAAHYAGGLSVEQIRAQRAEVDAWNARHGDRLRLFHGIEADILPDGTLDYAADGDVLDSFDFVIGSVHSNFRMDRDEMTVRVVRALADPRLTMLAHPTGRLLLSRDGYAIDLDAVFEAAAAHGVIIEINCDPRRMELDWREWPRALGTGVLSSINPDAHSPAALSNVDFGVSIARKGGLGPADVLNCWPLEDVERYLLGKQDAA
jgi:DNA polymerase (family X)